jgi:isochorismate hydrolase
MVRALSVPDIRAYYLPEKQTWPEDKVDGTQCAGDTVDKAIVTIGTPS